jgi:hypothetical protein
VIERERKGKRNYRNEKSTITKDGRKKEKMDERWEQRTNQLTSQPYTAESFGRS